MSNIVQEIDYLFEDPAIPGQSYALISVVGPNLQQKCNVYGIKIRGFADSIERAKNMSQRLSKIDENFDIYTVEVGKFFPLDVDPLELPNVEYQNTQLNQLVKGYLENRENANIEYEKRKNDMIKKAISEGKTKDSKTEHPVAVLNRIEELQSKIEKSKNDIVHLLNALEYNKNEYDKFPQDIQSQAQNEFDKLKQESESNADSSVIRKLSDN